MLAAAILSAGESRRMGTPKALLSYRGTTFLEHLLAITQHPRIGITRVVLGAGAGAIRDKLHLETGAIVVNNEWVKGQLSSIQAAVRSLGRGETEGLILCPVDHPLVSTNLVSRLIEGFDSSGKAVVLPTYKGRRGHPVIFRATLYDELLDAAPELGARQVVWAHADDVLAVPPKKKASS